MKNLRVGVIGVGGIARSHMPGWKQSPHTEVVASSDINAEALEKWGKNHGISKLYQDPIKLINEPKSVTGVARTELAKEKGAFS